MVTMGLLLCTTAMLALVKLTSAAAVGSVDGGPANSLCQLSGTNTSTTELLPILLKEENYDKLSGSAPLFSCASGLFCADGSNVTLPHQLQLASGFRDRRAVIKFTLLPDGNISAVVTTHLSLLSAAIKQLSFWQFCCVDEVSNTVKCFMPELKFAPVQNMSAVVVNNSSPVAGDSVTLTCPLISNPPGNYSWALMSGLNTGPFDRSNQRVLVLAPLKREHIGCYLCRLVNELDTKDVDTCSRVEVQCVSEEKAAFQVSAPQVEVEEGSTVTVNCSWSHKKLNKFYVAWWSPNETEVHDVSFHSDDFTCTGWLEMRIENFTAAKEGDYTCEDVSNTLSPKAVRLILAKPPNTTGVPLEYETPSEPAAVIAGVSVSVVVLLVAIVTVVLVGIIVYWTRRTITIRKIPLDLPPREGFEYDVFLSYHDECDGLVRQLILGPLRAAGYAVCYHHDDFEPGVGIYDNIHSNMDKSRVAVLVLTESYTASEYCMEEMHYAVRAVYSTRTRRLLPVAWRKEDVPKELGGWTYLEVKEGREGELADDIRDWIGDPIAKSDSDMP